MRLDLDKQTVRSGAHARPEDGMCIMEMVAYIAREQHSDNPQCVSPVIGAFLRAWNDALSDEDRQMLKPLIPVVMDTRSTAEDETRRAWMATDWLVRVQTPAWLRLAGLVEQAELLESLAELTPTTCPKVQPVLEAVRKDAAAAWAAAWAAVGDAAWAAVGAAVGAAAGDAAWAAVGDAVGAAAWAAVGDAVGAAAWAAVGDAAGDAARDALRPTVEQLQQSALELVERMAWLKSERD